MKTNGLTYEKANELFRYDAETGVLERRLKLGRWKICGDKPICEGYGMVRVADSQYLTHRVIWLLVHGEWPKFIDHKDRDRMNNRLENLRAVTPTENNHNRYMNKNNTSGYIGVSFSRRDNKYLAQICLNYKDIYLGLFPTAEEAFTAYMIAKIQYHPSSPEAQQYLRELTLAG